MVESYRIGQYNQNIDQPKEVPIMAEMKFFDRLYINGRKAAADKLEDHIGKRMTDLIAVPTDTLYMVAKVLADREVPSGSKLDFVLSIGYLFLPFDLIPDKWRLIGLLDDSVAVVTSIGKVLRTTERERLLEYWQGDPDMLDSARNLSIKIDEKIGSGMIKKMTKLTKMIEG